jgi:indole-3-glycerol phosphate synthase
MAEFDVTALALAEPAPPMAEAARATRLPMLSLERVSTREGALAARAFGADAVLVDPDATEAEREATAASARSTRMVALQVARTREEVEGEVARGARAVLLEAEGVGDLVAMAEAAGRLIVVALPSRPQEDDVRRLLGRVDAVVVGIEVYGATGFERLVSEVHL